MHGHPTNAITVTCVTRRLAEVAKYVGVSEATVSRVLNGKPGISEAHPHGGAHRP